MYLVEEGDVLYLVEIYHKADPCRIWNRIICSSEDRAHCWALNQLAYYQGGGKDFEYRIRNL